MNRNSRFLVVLLVALVASAAAAYGIYRVVSRMPVREVEIGTVPTVVAAREIPVGTLIAKDHLKTVPWPAKSPIPGSFTDTDKVLNRGAIVAVAENEPVTESKLAPVGAGGGLPPTIPEGMRAISVRTNEVVGVAGFVVPGTRVDVVVTVKAGHDRGDTMSRVVLQNVQVLTAGTRYDQEKAKKDGKPIQTSVITLLLTPDDAEKLTLASAEGQIMLTLRNPMDVAPTQTQGIRMAGLLGGPSAAPVEKRVEGRKVVVKQRLPEAPPPPKIYTVEAIRAAKRTEEPVR